VPCVVGGGVTPATVADWIATGAEFVAVGRAIWQAAEPPAAALAAFISRMRKTGGIG